MRLIDADAYEFPGDLVNEPTIDAVEVVRCKDCIHHTDDIMNDAVVWCEKSGLAHLCDFYCAEGEKI